MWQTSSCRGPASPPAPWMTRPPKKQEVVPEASPHLLMRNFLAHPSRQTRETPPRAVSDVRMGHAATRASLCSYEKAQQECVIGVSSCALLKHDKCP